MKYLSVPEQETLKVLSTPRFWNKDIFKVLINNFNTGYPITAFSELNRFSFVQKTVGKFQLHPLMRESLQVFQDQDLKKEVHNFMLDFYSNQLKDVDIEAITPEHETAFTEAFYHASQLILSEILLKESTFIFIVERKNPSFIHGFINTIINNHNIGFACIDRNGCTELRQYSDCHSECIVLTDGIRVGKEISNIINFLEKKNIKVLKVCGYLACKNSLDNARKKFPQIEFKFVHDAKDSKEYIQYFREMILISLPGLSTPNSEYPYVIYKVFPKINGDDALRIIQSLCGSTTVFKDELFSGDVVGYTVEFEDLNFFNCLKFVGQINDLQIERLYLRFKLEKSKSLLKIIAHCVVTMSDIDRDPKKCDIKKFIPEKNAYCNILRKSERFMCLTCLYTNLSILLDEINEKIKLINNGSYNKYNMLGYDHTMIAIEIHNPFKII